MGRRLKWRGVGWLEVIQAQSLGGSGAGFFEVIDARLRFTDRGGITAIAGVILFKVRSRSNVFIYRSLVFINYMYLSICHYVFMYISLCIYVYVMYICICHYVFMYISLSIYHYVFMYMSLCIYVYVTIYLCIFK